MLACPCFIYLLKTLSKLSSLLAFAAPKEEVCPEFFAPLLAFAELEDDCPELGTRL
jgi:hypothetical protein